MADSISTGLSLNVGLSYSDPETGANKLAYLSIPNPKSNLTENEIRAGVSPLITNNIIMDKHGRNFSETAITTAYTEATEKIEIDIDVE